MKPIVAGNWKMNKTVDEGVFFVNEVKNRILDKDSAEVIFCPPFTSLFSIANLLDNSPFYLGAQNVHHEIQGAYTGEISIQMLKSLSVDYVILGHSERRTIFGESSDFVRDKIDTVLNQGIKAILCIGETLDERRSRQTEKVLQNQFHLLIYILHVIFLMIQQTLPYRVFFLYYPRQEVLSMISKTLFLF